MKRGEDAQLDFALARAMVDQAVDGIIAIDASGTIELMNPAAERLFGYRAPEVVGKNIALLMPEPYRSEHQRYLQTYLATGERRIIGIGREVVGRRKDGSTFPMYLAVSELRHGERRLFTGTVHDLSALKQAEEHAAELQRRQELILNAIGEGVLGLDAEGRVTFANPVAADILGWSRAEMLGLTIEAIWPGPYAEGDAPTRATRIEDCFYSDHALFRRHDGSLVEVELIRTPIREAGEPVGAVINFQDITERTRAAQELQRMRAYLKDIIDSMPSILVGVDRQGRVTEWNQSAAQATGVPAAQALGRSFVELFPQLESQLALITKTIRRRTATRSERLVTRQEGELRYADVMIYPLVANGTVGAVVRVDDVTNRIRIEQMMVQTEKMVSVGGLAAGMAHEINNPLSGVLQSCQNLQRRLSADVPANRAAAEASGLDLERLHEYLERRGILHFLDGIREAATRATRIVEDMLAFSRRSDAQHVFVPVEEMLETVIRLAASDYDLKKKYDFRQITIVRDYDPELRPVRCDRTQIEQVLLNLVCNAAQAFTEGSEPRCITLRTRQEHGHACVQIEDNGPGMDEQTRRRVFEPFFTTKPAGTGTGLGLSVSYFIIAEQHGGSIAVDSTPGRGACFTIRLPVQGRGAS
jgi:PAS domain S-box-containing protein